MVLLRDRGNVLEKDEIGDGWDKSSSESSSSSFSGIFGSILRPLHDGTPG